MSWEVVQAIRESDNVIEELVEGLTSLAVVNFGVVGTASGGGASVEARQLDPVVVRCVRCCVESAEIFVVVAHNVRDDTWCVE